MVKFFEKMIFVFVFFVSACGDGERIRDIVFNYPEAPSPTTDVFFGNLAPDAISVAVDTYGGFAFLDNVDCKTIEAADFAYVCNKSNESFQRILGFTSFATDVVNVFIPIENWGTFLTDVVDGGEMIGVCIVDSGDTWFNGKKYSKVTFSSYSYKENLLGIFNHERTHCTLGSLNHEVMSTFMGFLLTIDQAIIVSDTAWTHDIQEHYYEFGGPHLHTAARLIFWEYLRKEFKNNEESFSHLVNNFSEKVFEWTTHDWWAEDFPAESETPLYVYPKRLINDYFVAYSESLYGVAPCTQLQIDNEDCALAMVVEMPKTQPEDPLNKSLKVKFSGGNLDHPEFLSVEGNFWSMGLMEYLGSNRFESVFEGTVYSGVSNHFLSIRDEGKMNVYPMYPGVVTGAIELEYSFIQGQKTTTYSMEVTGGDVCLHPTSDLPGFWIRTYSDQTTKEVTIDTCH